MKLKKIIFNLIFILGLFSSAIHAKSTKYSSIKYKTRKLMDLELIYRPFLNDPETYSDNLKMVRVTKKVNKRFIKDFKEIPAGVTIELFLNSELINLKKVNTYLAKDHQIKFNLKSKKIQSILVTTGEKESLATLYQRFALPSAIIRKKTPIVQATLNSNFNQDIKNWRKLPKKRQIRLYISPEFIDMKKVARFLRAQKRKEKFLAKRQKELILKRFREQKNTAKNQSLFYMTSLGTFSQEDSVYGTASFSQNSPLTLGYMYNKKLGKISPYSLSTSIYFSYLTATSSNISSSTTDVPFEIGANIYGELKTNYSQFFSGLDIERFNTFNIEGINKSNELLLDQNLLSYITLGYSNNFNILKNKILFYKLSIAQSVYSSRSTSYSDEAASGKVYSGQRFLFFTGLKFSDHWSMNFLLKYHLLSGPSNVSSIRTGLGASYLF